MTLNDSGYPNPFKKGKVLHSLKVRIKSANLEFDGLHLVQILTKLRFQTQWSKLSKWHRCNNISPPGMFPNYLATV